MLKQGSNWHDITDYYRARKKAVNLKAETGDKKYAVLNEDKKGKVTGKEKGSRGTC